MYFMPRFTEEQLAKMCRPASDSEETKLDKAESILKQALKTSTIIDSSRYEVFGQGSYANNTNIRLNSDIDINVCYTNAFFYDIPNGTKKEDFGIGDNVSYSFGEYKDDIEKMLVLFYGRSEVIRKNKCITVKGSTSRIQIDVVPTWVYKRYNSKINYSAYVEGVVLFTDKTGEKITNYPKQHKKNGVSKNTNTHRWFKRLTRIFKNIRIKMESENFYSNDNITSFLLECLAYNVPTPTYTKNMCYCVWNDILRDSIIYLYENTKEEASTYLEWGEVSELLYLMKCHKWTREDVNTYMVKMWNYLEFN